MEQQPVRMRRRRRRGSSAARREALAWVTYLADVGRRAFSWAGIILLVAFILLLGLGGPFPTVERWFSIWGHW